MTQNSPTDNPSSSSSSSHKTGSTTLRGKRLKLYEYLMKNQDSAFGPRELQRTLDWSSVSLVDYHLQKLVELELVQKTTDQQYQVKHLLSVGQYQNCVIIGDNFVPKNLIYLVFISSFLILAICLAVFHLWPVLLFSFFIFTLIVLIVEIYRIMGEKLHPRN